ncbi:hypothetical protein TgHK011_004246 [Trichoderma gracile]|nr:hypothetical protein TgHK011_004246 [Trichoderma gracile]
MTFSKPREWSGNYGRQCSRTEESADISNSLLGSLNSTEISIRRTDALLVRVEIPQLRPDGLTRLPLLTGHNCYYRCRCWSASKLRKSFNQQMQRAIAMSYS